jgi:hypothetical protein
MNGLSQMEGHMLIDGVDAYTELGFVVMPGSMESWLAPAERKTPFFHNWADENGIEVDLEHVYLKEKKVSLKVCFIANYETEFWEKYNRTCSLLAAPGLRTIYYRELEKEFEVYYEKATEAKAITRIKNGDKILFKLTIHLVMPNPGSMVERLEPPTGLSLYVNDVHGSGTFSYTVSPVGAPQRVRITLTDLTGRAYRSGNTIVATYPGTVRLRVESTVDGSIYAEKVINVYPDNLLGMAGEDIMWSGEYYITWY